MGDRLKGKVALVAGAGCVGPGWGNGRATAVIFAQEGARVFAVDRDAEAMTETVARAREAGGDITTHLCDVTDPMAVAAMVEARLAKQRAGGDVEALLKQRVSRIPLGFMGDGRDTAYAALFLASDEARFVTGTEIVVDGGMTARCD